MRSSYPIVSIYELNAESGDVPQARLVGSEDALKDGKTIGEAAILALRESSAFDLKANLAGLMASAAIVAASD